MCAGHVLAAQNASSSDDIESLASRAAAAKAAGQTEATFPSRGVTYPVVSRGLNRALSDFTVIVGTPSTKQTVIKDGSSLATWYSIKIKQVIVEHPCKMCALLTTAGLPPSLQPNKLLPVPPQSMLLIRRGGTTNIDGVNVTETEKGLAELTLGKEYLFVVDKASSGIARLVLNDAGLFVVGENGETLTPITGTNNGKAGGFPTLSDLRKNAQTVTEQSKK